MKYIYIGDIVNTHGLKGEVRLISDFEYKKKVFKKGFKLYIGRTKEEVIINTYRVHKEYDMLTFEGLTSIDDVIIYKGDKVYINRSDLKIRGYFNEDLIGLSVYANNNYIGKVEYIMKNKAHNILVVTEDEKGYVFYEAKFRKNPITNTIIQNEIKQVNLTGLNCYKYVFIYLALDLCVSNKKTFN